MTSLPPVTHATSVKIKGDRHCPERHPQRLNKELRLLYLDSPNFCLLRPLAQMRFNGFQYRIYCQT